MNPLDAIKPATTGGFSFFELFMTAHPVVKFVMIGLLLASIWAWAIIIEKLFAFRRARHEADKFEQQFWSGQSLEELYAGLSRGRTLSMAALFVAAMREWKRSVEGNIRAMGGIQLRVEKVMDVTISREMEQLDRRLLFLATVGSTAPFIGLFGTVWGIMTSFQAIAASKNTSLAVVAPGIAEALFATALGLLAAIPAVIFYNKFAADFRGSASGWKPSPTSSRPSSRARSTCGPEPEELSPWRPAYPPRNGPAAAGAAAPASTRRWSEINVTPFVDVMLVLLIIFMVTAPMLTSGVPIELPETKGQQLQTNKEPVTISVDKSGKMFIGDTEVSLGNISEVLKARAKNGTEEQIFIRGDKGIDYGTVMRVMGRVKAAGFTKVSLVTETEGT